jgi:DNA-binding NarL/FixJ family response regulator
MPTRIVLVDDHELFRRGLAALISGRPECAIVGEADNARSALSIVEQAGPDVVVADLALAGENGISLTRALIRRDDKYKILILTASVSIEYAAQAFAAGALGYSVKHESADSLFRAIAAVAAGRRYVSPMLPQEAMQSLLDAGRKRGPLGSLSVREREVFEMLVRGLDNRAVANHLFISVNTVETHRARIMNKLEIHSLSDLIRFAARHGLLLEAAPTSE